MDPNATVHLRVETSRLRGNIQLVDATCFTVSIGLILRGESVSDNLAMVCIGAMAFVSLCFIVWVGSRE